jgi:hypothetical protein
MVINDSSSPRVGGQLADVTAARAHRLNRRAICPCTAGRRRLRGAEKGNPPMSMFDGTIRRRRAARDELGQRDPRERLGHLLTSVAGSTPATWPRRNGVI